MESATPATDSPGWRVDTLAPDFKLLDTWYVPLELRPGDRFADFYRVFLDAGMGNLWPPYSLIPRNLRDVLHLVGLGALGFLLGLRFGLGFIFRWDVPKGSSIRERLTDEDLARDRSTRERAKFEMKALYCFENEALHEVHNRTIHALMHLGWVEGGAQVGVYIRPHGRFSDFYMAGIRPFRYAVVYPTMIEHLRRCWAVR